MDRETYREVMRLIRPLYRKIALAANRAVVELVDDSKGMQRAQSSVVDGEVHEPEHMQPGGLTHVPLPGAEGVFVTVSGARDDGVVICVSDRRYRPKNLAPGETALYNDASAALQCTITMKADGSIAVDSPVSVTVTAPTVHLGGENGSKVASADRVDDEFSRLWDLLTGAGSTPWVVAPTDGGGALKVAATAVYPDVASVAVSKTHAE